MCEVQVLHPVDPLEDSCDLESKAQLPDSCDLKVNPSFQAPTERWKEESSHISLGSNNEKY
jgi:hypothetical protein